MTTNLPPPTPWNQALQWANNFKPNINNESTFWVVTASSIALGAGLGITTQLLTSTTANIEQQNNNLINNQAQQQNNIEQQNNNLINNQAQQQNNIEQQNNNLINNQAQQPLLNNNFYTHNQSNNNLPLPVNNNNISNNNYQTLNTIIGDDGVVYEILED